MADVKRLLAEIWTRPAFVPAYLALALLVGGLLIWTDTGLVRLTDEDDYMPLGAADLLAGRNPYATGRATDHSIDLTCTWHDEPRCWYSLPYLPLSILLQLPLADYRWTSLAAFGLLGLAVRDRPWAFLALANPLALLLAANGFTDLVVVALLAWAVRTNSRLLGWLAAGAKQFALPILVVLELARGERLRALQASAAAALVCLPFLLWDARSFLYWTAEVHVVGGDDKWSGVLGIGHGNYLLYYAFAATVLYPEIKRHRRRVPLERTRPPTLEAEA